MSIGHDKIDADHKHLIEMLNRIETSQDLATTQAIAKELFLFAQEHFKREEQIQEKHRYPYRKEHKAEHEMMLWDMRRIIKTRFVDRIDSALATSELHALVQQWVVDHFMQSDLRMKHFLTPAAVAGG